MFTGLLRGEFVVGEFCVVGVGLIACFIVEGAVLCGEGVAQLQKLLYCEDVLTLEFEDWLELGFEDFQVEFCAV